MKKALVWFPALVLLAAGCLPLWEKDDKDVARAQAKPVVPYKPAEQPKPVTADQVDEVNARAMAQALVEELDREAQAETPPKPVAPATKKP